MIKIRYAEYKELPEVYRVVAKAFDKTAGYFKRFVEENPYYKGDDFFIAEVDGKIAAAIQVLLRDVYFNKQRMMIGGIGQVATLPKYRGKGLAGKLLTATLEYMKKNKVDYSLLFAGPVPLYRKYGWEELPVKSMLVKVKSKKNYKIPLKYKIRKWNRKLNYNLFQLHNDYIKNFNSCVIRNTVYWDTYCNGFKSILSDFYMLEDNKKNLLAYISVEKEWNRLNIKEYGAQEVRNDEYFKILFNYVITKYKIPEIFISAGNNFYMPYYVLKKEYNGKVINRTGFMTRNINTKIDWKKSMNKMLFFDNDSF